MLDRRASKELRSAIEAFEALASMRLEERGAIAAGPAEARLRELARRPLGLPGSDNLPPVKTFAGEGPLGKLVDGYDLTDAEAVAVVAALAPEVDEKFDVLYA